MNKESDEEFDEQFHEREELTDEADEEVTGGFHEREELTDETDEGVNGGFHEREELTEETDEGVTGGFHEREELTEETDEGVTGGFHEREELTDETDKGFEPFKESQKEGETENEEVYENIGFQSTVLVHEDSEMDAEYQQNPKAESEETHEQELDPEEYEKDQEPIYDTDEISFIRDMEELGRDLKEVHEELGCSKDELEEYDNTGFNAEKAYQEMKEKNREKEVDAEDRLEEHEQSGMDEQEGEENREKITEGEFKEEDELPKEITGSEEFEYLWEEYDKLEQERKSLEEISELMHEAEESYQKLKNYEEGLEEIYERQEKQDLESIDHKNEEELGDYRKEVESVYEAEYFIDAEIKLKGEGKSPEEVTEEMQKVEDRYELEEEVEARFRQQKNERFKSFNHEDEEEDDDQREEIDRVDVIECVVEAGGEFHKQGKSQEEIDEETEKIANKFYKNEIEEQQQNEQEKKVDEELGSKEAEIVDPELAIEEQDQINHSSVDNNDENIETYPEGKNKEELKELNAELDSKGKDDVKLEQESINESIMKNNKPEAKESEEEEYEKFQQLYRQETGRRPLYRGNETKGFSQWLEQKELNNKKLEEKEEKKQEEERWKKILKDWIEESKDELLSSELKLILKEILQKSEVLENLNRKFVKSNLTERERDKWFSDLKKYLKKYPIRLNLHQNIYGFKVYVQESHPWDINRIKNRFLRHLAKKYENLKQGLKNLSEFIRVVQKYNFNEEEVEFLSELKINISVLKRKWEWMNKDLVEKYFRYVFGPYLLVNPRLRSDDFKALGFDSFLRRLERKRFSYRNLKAKIPITKEILSNIFSEGLLELKIARANKKMKSLGESGYKLPINILFSEVINFLNLKNEEIVNGYFIPSLNNIIESSNQVKAFFNGVIDKQELKGLKQRVGLAVRYWINKNPDLPFSNLEEIKGHFKSDTHYNERGLAEIELIDLVKAFINHIENEILLHYRGDKKELLNNGFNEYQQFLTQNIINKDEILENILNKTNLNELFKTIKLYEGGKRRIQAKRCLQVIALALIKCSDYDCLEKNLKKLTKLKRNHLSKLIRSYIPLLSKIDSNLDVNKWLNNNISYSLSQIKDLVRRIGLEKVGKEGKLKQPKTEIEFKKLTEIYSPSLVPLKISCEQPGHMEFKSTANRLQQDHWCKACSYDQEKRVKKIIIDIVSEITTLRKKGLKDNEILNITLSKSFIIEFSEGIKKKGYIHSIQIERIIQVISLALLGSSDYYSLKEKLKKLTNLSDNQLWRNIVKYIPILAELFPDIDTDKWLLQPYSTISKTIIRKFKKHLNQKVMEIKEGIIKSPLSIEEIRLESVQDELSTATASRLAHEILKDKYDKFFQTYTQYDRQTFINELEQLLKDNYHLATDLVLKLYKLTDLKPNEFVKSFYPKASFLIKALSEHVNFRRKDTITKIKIFIDRYFIGGRYDRRKEALKIYFDYLNLKEKALIDENIPFDFVYLENRIINIKNPFVRNALLGFFKDFGKRNHPIGIFNNEEFTRVSLLKLKGDKNRIISVKKAINYFKDELKYIRSRSDSPLFRLCEICKEVNASNLFVDHPKILGRILSDYDYALAAEIPVWKKIFEEFITGHIDIIFFDGSDLIIGDYKRNLREIKEGLCQITTYALLLKELLIKYSTKLKNIEIKCIGFCENLAIEFNPEVIAPSLLSFIQYENEIRKRKVLNELLTVKTRNKKIQKSLYFELKKALFESKSESKKFI